MKYNTLKLTFGILLVCCTGGLFVNCGTKVVAPVDEEITTDTASTEAKLKLDAIFVNIPSPVDLTKELAKSGFNYDKGKLNPSSKAGGYSTNYKAAINLGVYGADLGYTTSYGQTQDALGYLNVIKQLADKVGVGAAFDEAMVKRFESNVSNKDTLEFLINHAYEKASRNLRSNQRVSTSAVVSAGQWVEGLYISLSVIAGETKNDKNEAVFMRAWNELYAYKYVAELLNLYTKNPDCAQMLKDLAPMEALSATYAKKTTLTPDDVKQISEKLMPIRNGMVN